MAEVRTMQYIMDFIADLSQWLHLCAFSWGGLTTSPKSTKLVYRSSDIPENLIIGTSETNSVMTR
jgi:hypothetical protein